MPHKTLYLDELEDRNDKLSELREKLKAKTNPFSFVQGGKQATVWDNNNYNNAPS